MSITLGDLDPTLALVPDHILKLRLVCKRIKLALESNVNINISICINKAGVEGLNAAFLQRWCGRVQLHCTHLCNLRSRWFREVRDALVLDRLRPLSLLSLSVEGRNLFPLVEKLVGMGPAIQELQLNYIGNNTELLAAAALLATIGRALTMKISIDRCGPRGGQPHAWLQQLSSIRIKSISFRSVL